MKQTNAQVATRKGLFQFTRGAAGWAITHVAFPGDPVNLTLSDARDGAPLAGASVVLEPLDGKPAHGTPVITDAQGLARFAAPPGGRFAGRWRANVVWTQPISHPRAEFDTVFSSLTFGD